MNWAAAHTRINPAPAQPAAAGASAGAPMVAPDIEAPAAVEMVAVGSGVLDFNAILESTIEAGSRIIYVEQDSHTRDPFDDALSSYQYLEKLMRI